MDVQGMTVAGVTIAGTEDEDPAEYFDGHADVRELPDPLVDGAEDHQTMKGQQKELDRLAELRVYETLESSHLRHAGSCTTERTESERHSSQESSKGDETMYDGFAPSSTPSTGRIIDYLSLRKAYHTFIADETSACFPLDERSVTWTQRLSR